MIFQTLEEFHAFYQRQEAHFRSLARANGDPEEEWVNLVGPSFMEARAVIKGLVDMDKKLNAIKAMLEGSSNNRSVGIAEEGKTTAM